MKDTAIANERSRSMKHEIPYEIENKVGLSLEEARAQLAYLEKKIQAAAQPDAKDNLERDALKCHIARLEAALAAH